VLVALLLLLVFTVRTTGVSMDTWDQSTYQLVVKSRVTLCPSDPK